MYVDTTKAQVVRSVGMWLLVVGGIALYLTGGGIATGRDVGFGAAALACIVTGGVALWWSRRRLRALDVANRPYLLSEGGASVMRKREETSHRIRGVARYLLAGFAVLGTGFFFLLSAASCGDRIDGYCGEVGKPSDTLMVAAQAVALVAGAAWVVAIALRRTHDKESDRIDKVVAEGQRARKHDDPLASLNTRGWE